MADENKNTGPDKSQTRQTISSLGDVKKDQGDFNDLLKDSINLLKQVDRSYERIESRLETLNKSEINVKTINNELLKAKQKQRTTAKELGNLESSLSDKAKIKLDNYTRSQNLLGVAESKLRAAKESGDVFQIKQQEALYNRALGINERQKERLGVEEASIIGLREANKIAEEGVKYGQQKLDQEKQIQKDIGLTGAVFGVFAKKLGIGSKYYESMVEKSRELNTEGKKLTFFDKLKGIGAAAGGAIKETAKDPFALVAAIGTAIPIIGGAISGIVGGLKTAFDFILGIQDQTVKFARAMNLSTVEARKLKMEYADLNVASGDLFITSQKMLQSQVELSDALGVTNKLTKEQLATDIKLRDIAGLDLETRKGIVETSTITGKSSEALTKSVLSQVVGLKQATGISFQYQKTLKEASSLGGTLGLSFAKYPEKLTKSLLTVKSMGLELKQLDGMADSFLDFESSISKEFEAQLLTGKDINLAKAREAFLNNDLATAAEEITKQVGTASEFLSMNRIQQESIASAMGMSRDQMADMLKQQELFSKLGAKDLKDAQAKVEALKAQGKTREEIAKLVGEEAYQNLTNASAQEKIAAFVDKIRQSFSDFIEKSGLIEKIEGFMDYLSKPENIKKVIEGVRDFFAGAVEFIGKAAYYILEGLDYVAFGQIPDAFIDSIKSGAENMGAQIRSMGGDLGGIGVGENKAKNEVVGTTPTTIAADNMSMRPNNNVAPKVYNVIIIDPITGKSVEKVVSQQVFETVSGIPTQ